MMVTLPGAQGKDFSSRRAPPQPKAAPVFRADLACCRRFAPALSTRLLQTRRFVDGPRKDFRRKPTGCIFESLPARNRAGHRRFAMTSTPSPIDPRAPGEHDASLPPLQRWTHSIFLGPHGLRAGWRLLIAVGLFVVAATSLRAALIRVPAIHAWLQHQIRGVITPGALLFGESITVLAVLFAAGVMARVEKRSFVDYGLPGGAAFGKRFWQGLLYGFAMISLLMALIVALHGFSLGGWALTLGAAVRYAALYVLGFLLVAVFEEFSFRGYMQATLGSGIGFWPAAVILALAFGSIHLHNPGEARYGALMAGSFGLLAAFSLRRTGSIWFAIGMHAAWDWGETYFYSVPDSGFVAKGHLLNSSFHGPNWLTGGTAGPEASVFAFVVLALSAAAVHYLFPAKHASR
jgi:CAAX protease family protein